MKALSKYFTIIKLSGKLSFIFLVHAICFCNESRASHATGMDIAYRCLGGLQYEFTLNFYRDCDGIDAPTSITISINSASCAVSTSLMLQKLSSVVDITPLCPTAVSSCAGGVNPGVEHHIYRDTMMLPSSCSDWIFSYGECCRNDQITNLVTPSSWNLYVESKLDNTGGICNSSPSFTTLPVPYICASQNVNYNLGAFDEDGDSLVYFLVNARKGGLSADTILYNVPYSHTYPITTDSGFVILDSLTGNLNLQPDTTQICVVTVLVKEYRDTMLIGSVIRDIQVIVMNCPVNTQPYMQSPQIVNLTGTGVLADSNTIEICAGNPLLFNLIAIDNDAADTITMTSNVAISIPGATFITSGVNPDTATFSWIPTNNDLGLKTFTVTVKDDACPVVGLQTYQYKIRVFGGVYAGPDIFLCGTDSVQLNATGSVLNYSWSPSTGLSDTSIANPMVFPSVTTTYIVTGDTNLACQYTDTIVVNVVPDFSLTSSPDTTVCLGGSTQISVTPTPSGSYTYAWLPTTGLSDPFLQNPGASPLTNTTYIASVTSSAGCNKTDTVKVTVDTTLLKVNPTAGNLTICRGDTTTLFANITSIPPSSYTLIWKDSAGNIIDTVPNIDVAPYVTSTYTATISNNICSDTKTITISVNYVNAGADTMICSNDSIQLNAVYTGQTGTIIPPSCGITASCGGTGGINDYAVGTGATSNSSTGYPAPYGNYYKNAKHEILYRASELLAAGIKPGSIKAIAYNVADTNGTLTYNSYELKLGCTAATTLTAFTMGLQTVFNPKTVIVTTGWNVHTLDTPYDWDGVSNLVLEICFDNLDSADYTYNSSTYYTPTGYNSVLYDNDDVTLLCPVPGFPTTSPNRPNTRFTVCNDSIVPVFSWTPTTGLSNPNISNPKALVSADITYMVTVNNGICSTKDTINLIAAPAVVVTTSSVNASCGNPDGSATAIVSGGVTPYTYLWSDSASQTVATATGLYAGAYTVNVSDSNNCKVNNIASVSNTGAPTVSISSKINVSCAGFNNGSATASATGGSTPYTYLWNDPASQSDTTATGLSGGTYIVTVTDTNSCIAVAFVTIAEPAPLSATISGFPENNIGGCDGLASLTTNGGTSPYTYLWNDPAFQTTSAATGLCSGTFSVTVTDSLGCIYKDSIILASTPPDIGVLSIDTLQSGCGLTSAETIYITLRNYGDTLVAGTSIPVAYAVNGFPVDETLIISSPLFTGTNLSYTFSTTADLSLSGNYTIEAFTKMPGDIVTSNDSSALVINNIFTINTFPLFQNFDSNSDGWETTGTNSSWSWGVPSGTYIPAAASPTNAWVTNLSGNYNTNEISYLISPCLNFSSFPNDPKMSFQHIYNTETNWDEGWIDYSTNGGSTWTKLGTGVSGGMNWYNDLTNNWWEGNSPGGTGVWDTASHTLTGLKGLSNVRIRFVMSSDGSTNYDGFGVDDFKIYDPNPANDAGVISLTSPVSSCGLTSSESIIIKIKNYGSDTISGFPVSYTVNGGTPITEIVATKIFPGDSLTFTFVTKADLSVPTTYIINSYTSLTGDADNTNDSLLNVAVISIPLITSYPYLHTFDTDSAYNGAVSQGTPVIPLMNGWQNDQNDSPLDWAPRSVEPASANGPGTDHTTGSSNFIYAEDNFNFDSINLISPCFDISSLVNPYLGFWYHSNSNNVAFVSTLSMDIYSGGKWNYDVVTPIQHVNNIWNFEEKSLLGFSGIIKVRFRVNNNNGTPFHDIAIDDVSIGNKLIVVNLGNDTSICMGDSVVLNAGNAGSTYLWKNGAATQTITVTTADTIWVTVTDTLGFKGYDTVVVSVYAPANISFTSVSSNCGMSNGTAIVSASGIASPFNYLWDDTGSQTNDTASGLAAGIYTVTVTDSIGCTNTGSIAVNDSGAATVTITVITNVSCYGGSDGSASLIASGGTPPYTYSWNDPASQTTSTVTGLLAGNYGVMVKDSINCNASAGASIIQPSLITLSTTVINANCGLSNGKASVSATGGNGGYTFLWNDPASQTTDTASGLFAGAYMANITDSKGCADSISVSVSNIPAGTVSVSVTGVISCYGDCNGKVTATLSGGTAPYTYLWDDPASQNSATATALCKGTYTVDVTDSNGCVSSDSIVFTQPAILKDSISSSVNVSVCGVCNGLATVGVSGGTLPYIYLWNDSGSQITATATGLCIGNYTVLVTDNNGCKDSVTVPILGPGGFTSKIDSVKNVTCNGYCDGSATAVVTGGVSPYTYIWSPGGGSNAKATNLCINNYTVVVTDFSGCNNSTMVSITEPNLLAVGYIIDTATQGMSNGAVYLTPSGGTPPYSYVWMTGQTTQNLINISSGNYFVSVMDSNNCTKSFSVFIPQITGIGSTSVSVEPGFSIYPNPTSGIMIFDIVLGTMDDVQIVAQNILGETVYSHSLKQVKAVQYEDDLTFLHGGLYTVRLITRGKTIFRRIAIIK